MSVASAHFRCLLSATRQIDLDRGLTSDRSRHFLYTYTFQLHLGYIPYTFILTLDLDPLTLTLNITFPSTYGFDFQSVSNYGHDLASHMEKYRSKVSLSKKL